MNFKALVLSLAVCLTPVCAHAESRAELLQQAEEIKAQMYSSKTEIAFKLGTFGFLTAALVIPLLGFSFYSYEAYNALVHFETYGYLVDAPTLYESDEEIKKMVAAWSAEFEHNHKLKGRAFLGSITALGIGVWVGFLLDKQEKLKAKLEDIEKQITEIDFVGSMTISFQ